MRHPGEFTSNLPVSLLLTGNLSKIEVTVSVNLEYTPHKSFMAVSNLASICHHSLNFITHLRPQVIFGHARAFLHGGRTGLIRTTLGSVQRGALRRIGRLCAEE